jgi:hypothetical protein
MKYRLSGIIECCYNISVLISSAIAYNLLIRLSSVMVLQRARQYFRSLALILAPFGHTDFTAYILYALFCFVWVASRVFFVVSPAALSKVYFDFHKDKC